MKINTHSKKYISFALKKHSAILKHLPIKTQFILCMILLLLCMILLCTYTNRSIYKKYLSDTNLYATSNIDEFEKSIASIESNITNLCMQFQYNNTFLDIFIKDSYQQLTTANHDKMMENITSSIMVNPYIADISLANSFFHWSNIYTNEELNNMYAQMKGKDDIYCFGLSNGSLYNAPSNPHLTFGYNFSYRAKNIGCIFLSVDISDAFFLPYKDTCYILHDPSRSAIAPVNCTNDIAIPIIMEIWGDQTFISSNMQNTSQDMNYIRTTTDFWIQTTFIRSLGCYMTGAVNLQELNRQLRQNIIQLFILITLCVLFLMLFWLLITRSFINPFQELSETIIHIRKEKIRKIKTPLHIDGCKEIMDTSREFENMVNSIHDLNQEIMAKSHALYEAEIQRKISELSYLRSQINPHFIYNSLEIIRASATKHNISEISDTALAIGKILRYSVKGEEFVSLQKELDVTNSYLKIQHARFYQKFDFLINAPAEQEKLLVMKMLLQPIVENAVFHGIEPKEEHSVIVISACLIGSNLSIGIRDNGTGIPPGQLQSLKLQLDNDIFDSENHIGLINVHARLRLQYGKPYGVTVESTVGDGTVVTLLMPATYKSNP